ncbi:hypothetical protein Tco_0639094, partial [Tanacetum coccineum]
KSFDSEREKYNRARLEIQGYEIVLESLESRILGHENNELAWGEKYEFQNYELKYREIKINNLQMELEKVVKERDELKLKTKKWEESSKNLSELLNSQMSASYKTGLGYDTQLNEMSNNSETNSKISLSVFDVRSCDEETTPANDRFSKVDGYHAILPPIIGNFLTPRADISFASLDEFAIRKKIIKSQTTKLNTESSKPKTSEVNIEKPKSVVSTPNINREKVIIEDWNSDDEDDVSEVSPVKTKETTNNLIKDCNFHDKKSQEPKMKIVVNTGQNVDKPVWGNTKRGNHQNFLKYPHINKTFVPSGVLTRTGLVNLARPAYTTRPNVSTARPACTARPNVSTARPICAASPVSTARPVSTVRPFVPKIAQTGGAIRPIYPRMDNVIQRCSHPLIKRSYYTKPAFRPKDLK